MMTSLALAGRSFRVVKEEALVRLDVTGRLQAARPVPSASCLDKHSVWPGTITFRPGYWILAWGHADSTALCWKLIDRRKRRIGPSTLTMT